MARKINYMEYDLKHDFARITDDKMHYSMFLNNAITEGEKLYWKNKINLLNKKSDIIKCWLNTYGDMSVLNKNLKDIDEKIYSSSFGKY